MAKLDIEIPHGLEQQEALTRVKTLLSGLKEEHGDKISDLKEKWDGNTGTFKFSAMGYAISGTLVVGASKVKLSGELPWQAAFFKGKIEATIRKEAATRLA